MSLKEKLQVMVVDDMSVSRNLLTSGLENLGIKHVTYENDGKMALDALVASPKHLVLSDYNMPNMDGLELLRNLRQHKQTLKIGFILVTGSNSNSVVLQGQKLGMNNYLKKPFDEAGLRRCVESVVGSLG